MNLLFNDVRLKGNVNYSDFCLKCRENFHSEIKGFEFSENERTLRITIKNLYCIPVVLDFVKEYFKFESNVFSVKDSNCFKNNSGQKKNKYVDDESINKNTIKFQEVTYFHDADITRSANELLRTIYWAIAHNHARPKDMCYYLSLFNKEIAMKYNSKNPENVKVGDVVECCFGFGQKGEISGSSGLGIVCDVDNVGKTCFVVPIVSMAKLSKTKFSKKDQNVVYAFEISNSLLIFKDYINVFGGNKMSCIFLRAGKFINCMRVNRVIGHARLHFLSSLLLKLSGSNDLYRKYFNSTTGIDKPSNYRNFQENYNKELSIGEISFDDEQTISAVSDEDYPVERNESTVKTDTSKTSYSKKYLMEYLSEPLNDICGYLPMEDQLYKILELIGFKHDNLTRWAFLEACELKTRVTWNSIIKPISENFPELGEERIKKILKGYFSEWLEANPNVKEECSSCTFLTLLDVVRTTWLKKKV